MENTVTTQDETHVETTSAPSRVVKPRVDILDQTDAVVVVADMAGVSAETVEVTLERNVLTIYGTAAALNRRYQRAFTLSQRIDRHSIDASVKDGVLTLTLGKVAAAVPTTKQITVKSA